MKKILFYTLMLCLSSFALTSCNDDNDELTDAKVTYYPILEIQGKKFVEVPIGTTYTELGCKGTLRGEDCTSSIVTTGSVDTNKPGRSIAEIVAYLNRDSIFSGDTLDKED